MVPLFYNVLLFLALTPYALAITAKGYETSLYVHRDDVTTVGGKGVQPQTIVYTSVLEFDDDVSRFSNEQLAGLAKQAWDEMVELHELWMKDCPPNQGPKVLMNNRAGMMGIIASDKTLYISSSVKANSPNDMLQAVTGITNQATLTRALWICRMEWLINNEVPYSPPPSNEQQHRTFGSCAEIMGTSLCLKHRAALPWDAARNGQKARTVTYGNAGYAKRKGETKEVKLYPPCDNKDFDPRMPHNPIGCMEFVGWMNMDFVHEDTVIETVSKNVLGSFKVLDINLKDIWRVGIEEELDELKKNV